MKEGKPPFPWPGAEERAVIEEMLRNPESEQWHKCHDFIERCVQIRAKNISEDYRDDIIQNVMIRVTRYLPYFQHQCLLRTWLFNVTRSCIIDAYRKLALSGHLAISLDDLCDDSEHENEIFIVSTSETVENKCIFMMI